MIFKYVAEERFALMPPIANLKRPLVIRYTTVALSRRVDIWAECSKGLLPTVSTSGGVAACYGSGYALEFMREHMEQVW